MVHRAWDLGIGDDTSVWAFQVQGSQIVLLDHVATSGVGLEWWRDELFKRERERGWIHGTDFVPYDAKVKEFGTGRHPRRDHARARFLKARFGADVATIDDGINAVRRTLPLCVFHPRCEEGGISALEQYRREWDDEKKCFKANAVHDWSSHPSGCVPLSGNELAQGAAARDRRAEAAGLRHSAAGRSGAAQGNAAVSRIDDIRRALSERMVERERN